MIGNQLHTLSYLKQVTGTRAQAAGTPHVLALAPPDAVDLNIQLRRKNFDIAIPPPADMRMWRPEYGWAISSTDNTWLDIPTGFVVVHRAEVK